ncbi:MAG: hypothetical protein IKQ15_10510 [Kiritimatiellae bacterium]|nr:hypothetical protein [Kiritimatiellia bacterium]
MLSFRNAQAVKATPTLRLVSATLHNDGVAPLAEGAVVKFWRGESGGELLGTDSAGAVGGGDAGEYTVGFAWELFGETFTSAWERVVIELPDAPGAPSVSVWTDTPLDRDGDGLPDAEEAILGTDPEKADTNGDGISDYDHVYVWFTDPLAGMGGGATENTPVAVPHAWLESYPEALAAHGGDHEAFAADSAANGQPVWACYVAGLDPTDAAAEFKAVISFKDGKWSVTPDPDLNDGGAQTNRVYTWEGAAELGDEKRWGPTNAASRFFRAKVSMPE